MDLWEELLNRCCFEELFTCWNFSVKKQHVGEICFTYAGENVMMRNLRWYLFGRQVVFIGLCQVDGRQLALVGYCLCHRPLALVNPEYKSYYAGGRP